MPDKKPLTPEEWQEILTSAPPWEPLTEEEIADPCDIGAQVASRLLRERQGQLASPEQVKDRRNA